MTSGNNPHSQSLLWKKVCASLLLCTFTFTNTLQAAPVSQGNPYFYLSGHSNFDSKILEENPFGIRFSENDGSVIGFVDGNAELPLVVYLQDAHANITAQKKLQKIMVEDRKSTRLNSSH